MMLFDVAWDTMATTEDSIPDMTEECNACDASTPHTVTVEILTESPNPENAQYSREPYRVSQCNVCGATEKTRMNNA
jgi:hypothetical protein